MTSAFRNETRAERYSAKLAKAKAYPIIPVCINFRHEENVAFVVRSAACFGAQEVIVIGSLPDHNILKSRSGSTSETVKVRSLPNPHDLLTEVKNKRGYLVSAELTDTSTSIFDFHYPLDQTVYLVCGHEEAGVPGEILLQSDMVVHIPMPGVGYCLNTSQCATTMMYEYIRQYHK